MMSVQEDLHPAKLFMIYFIQSTLFHIYKMFVEDDVEPSGGQAQKLAIARALYKNAPIVILDEPTAALDPISEYEVYNNFDKLVNKKTAIYISHRLSSCKFCDRIIVFERNFYEKNSWYLYCFICFVINSMWRFAR